MSDRPAITRRDFINGVAAATMSAGAPFGTAPTLAATPGPDSVPPPRRTGLRGSHPGAFEAAHALRDGTLKPTTGHDSGAVHDLVVVGGGLSGLAAAHFFHRYAGAGKSVLILDNHDDFGGHAKRNEFVVDGHLLALNGGTLEIESPARYGQWARRVLDDIGVDLTAYLRENRREAGLYDRLGMDRAFFFDKGAWASEALVPRRIPPGASWYGFGPDFVARAPLGEKARADLARLLAPHQPDYLSGLGIAEKKKRLAALPYDRYLADCAGVDPSVVRIFAKAGAGVFCVGADAMPALFAWAMGYPGFSGLGLGELPQGLLSDLPGGQHGRQAESGSSVHFPDGNATLARLLVAALVPTATRARSQDEMGTAQFDYAKLDMPGAPTRIRLSTLALEIAHDGPPDQAETVSILCAPAGNPHPDAITRVRARQVVLACWNMAIPYMVPTLPAPQKAALSYGVKGPIVYANVAIRNWHAFHRLGAADIDCPSQYFEQVQLAEAASLGGLRAPSDPAMPNVVRLIKTYGVPGLPTKRDQHRAGRAMLLATSFQTFEAEIRAQMQRILGPGGFDAGRDIAAITVNRWPHGYAYTYNSLYDPPEWVFTESAQRPCVIGRQPFGRIAIANADSAASPHTDAALESAHRAVVELLDRQAFPFIAPSPGPATF
ncbi:NAD(P)-binding protein [Gluconacetobacter takamatsuzukensis]|uniref:NAD(P)/FAD-dependent oxidoreductase n=1 Tax=Gluconacetobacter takamatsuzukensis TaxID=1286190 RepID=A0A7W4PTS0_9PROT|nr:NAD(P)-binding protein [Gluconacetobacter takamatsuzukensis]MBB2206276.1 NAD(P)/FAD-dependent oxidoreductase [Gluconacetobacter takamatsuzukensis]